MVMSWFVEGTQFSKLIAGLLVTNGTTPPPRDRVWPTSCQLDSRAPEGALGLGSTMKTWCPHLQGLRPETGWRGRENGPPKISPSPGTWET